MQAAEDLDRLAALHVERVARAEEEQRLAEVAGVLERGGRRVEVRHRALELLDGLLELEVQVGLPAGVEALARAGRGR
ncbi:MAG: hypothetical protein M5U28_34665 [Sandaracinaceae bacterium]|nr:hypothetical protein [Sandaracinaceae bacterium]